MSRLSSDDYKSIAFRVKMAFFQRELPGFYIQMPLGSPKTPETEALNKINSAVWDAKNKLLEDIVKYIESIPEIDKKAEEFVRFVRGRVSK